jgi:Cu(I)/Ag(I) efflux system periplasmic protein CusF
MCKRRTGQVKGETMKRLGFLLAVFAAGWLFPPGILAAADNAAQPAAEKSSAEKGGAMTAGVVKKVDKAAGKVTISHEPSAYPGMEKKMTMVFRVKDPAMLDQLKEGDKINFIVEKVNGKFTVMQFEPAK